MNDLPGLYEKLSKCIKEEFDWTIERSKRLWQLDEWSMSYWEHKKDLSANPKRYPSPPYSPKKFGELVDVGANNPFNDEETNSNVCTSQNINVRGFREGQILTWSVASFNILQAIGLSFPNVPNTYKSFMYPIKLNPK
jgi:hypothetical protein